MWPTVLSTSPLKHQIIHATYIDLRPRGQRPLDQLYWQSAPFFGLDQSNFDGINQIIGRFYHFSVEIVIKHYIIECKT